MPGKKTEKLIEIINEFLPVNLFFKYPDIVYKYFQMLRSEIKATTKSN